MIKLKSNITLAHGFYTVNLSVHSVGTAEKDRVAELGWFEFAIGGDYGEGTFTLPTRVVSLADFPIQQAFSVELADAKARADLWVSDNISRIITAEAAWKAITIPADLGDSIYDIVAP